MTPELAPNPAPGTPPDREECVEQAYFFRTFRERLADNLAAQDILRAAPDDLLPSTKLPTAVAFLSSDLKVTGRLSTGFARLSHYFTPFQSFVISQAEEDRQRLTMPVALQILEREATYKAESGERAGLFVYQFEAIARNRLGYGDGLHAVSLDPVYLRSTQYVADERKRTPAYEPSLPPLFGDREGRIAKASRGRDPLFLFAALQRQLKYPAVPRTKSRDDAEVRFEAMAAKVRELETRLRMLEAETRGNFDPTQFGTPDDFRKLKDE
jgi:hypothetical protein